MYKILITVLLTSLLLTACVAKTEIVEVEDLAPTATCGNKICEIFPSCPEKNCPPSEFPHTCPQDCKLSCDWSSDEKFCTPKYENLSGEKLDLDSHLTYILDNYSCQTSLDCPFSHLCTDVKFLDPGITEGRICIFNSLNK